MPLIGILRKLALDGVVDVVAAAREAGLRIVEVTLDSPTPLDQIEALSRAFPDMTLGAGTITHPGEVAPAYEAGARFMVSPFTSAEIAAACDAVDVPFLAGAATPTEIHLALASGAAAVKVFPAAQLGGPAYISAIRSPLREPPLVPTGGVSLANAADYLHAGAVALGVGSALFPPELAESADHGLGEHVARWVSTVLG